MDKPTLANRLDRASGEIARLRTINADLLEALQAMLPEMAAFCKYSTRAEELTTQARAAIARATQK